MRPGQIVTWVILLTITGYLIHLNVRVFFPPAPAAGVVDGYESTDYEPMPVSTAHRWTLALCEAVPAQPRREDPFWISDVGPVTPEPPAGKRPPRVAPPPAPDTPDPVAPEPPRDDTAAVGLMQRFLASLPHIGGGGDAKPTSVEATREELPTPRATVRVVLVGPRARVAVTDEAVVREGDAIQGWIVSRITPQGIWVESAGRKVLLPLERNRELGSNRDDRNDQNDQDDQHDSSDQDENPDQGGS